MSPQLLCRKRWLSRVEIDGVNGLWADSGVEVEVAVKILRMAFADQEFGKFIPTTNREWDAYSVV